MDPALTLDELIAAGQVLPPRTTVPPPPPMPLPSLGGLSSTEILRRDRDRSWISREMDEAGDSKGLADA